MFGSFPGYETIGIEIEEEYVKIGLRRLKIETHYNGQELKRELRSYERKHFAERVKTCSY
jgi:site-specific DNA-methyltransferase (adenine-specific)